MKTFFIIGLARMVTKHHEKFVEKTLKTDLFLLGKIILILIVPLFFVLKQPDLGTGLVFMAITAAIIIVAGISWRIIVPIFAGVSAIGGTLLWMAVYAQEFLINTFDFKPYQFARIYSWLDPYSYKSDEGMHLITALNAIGSGEIFGKGFQRPGSLCCGKPYRFYLQYHWRRLGLCWHKYCHKFVLHSYIPS